tara:strand:+ start:2094 stop:2483 length:390 start_codon:yes stop_codon:yes gene_type:complete
MTLPSPMEAAVVGVTFRGSHYPSNIFAIGRASALTNRPIRASLEREPDNPVDPNAIRVVVGDQHVGYLSARLAEKLSPNIDGGEPWLATVDRVIVSPENVDQPGLRLLIYPKSWVENKLRNKQGTKHEH